MKKEDEIYLEIVEKCEEANRLIDLGYIMLDEEDKVINGKFIFNFMRTEGIYVSSHKKYEISYIHKDTCLVHGQDTVIEEYNEALKYLSEIKLAFVRNAIYPFKTPNQ